MATCWRCSCFEGRQVTTDFKGRSVWIPGGLVEACIWSPAGPVLVLLLPRCMALAQHLGILLCVVQGVWVHPQEACNTAGGQLALCFALGECPWNKPTILFLRSVRVCVILCVSIGCHLVLMLEQRVLGLLFCLFVCSTGH